MSAAPDEAPARGARFRARKRIVLAALAAVGVAAVIVAVIALRASGGTAGTAGATSAPTATASASASASDPTADPAVTEPAPAESIEPLPAPVPPEGAQEQPVAPEQEPVAPTETATGSDGAQVALVKTESLDVVGKLPGEVSGPGISVTVEITNTTDAPMNMDYVAVNLYTGADRTPALPIQSGDSGGFGGELAVDESATASYVFLVDEDAREDVLIGVDYLPGAATVTFRGSLEG
jgi:type IV secretory pathway VirB10-like protein